MASVLERLGPEWPGAPSPRRSAAVNDRQTAVFGGARSARVVDRENGVVAWAPQPVPPFFRSFQDPNDYNDYSDHPVKTPLPL
jgi:hypothetical protein